MKSSNRTLSLYRPTSCTLLYSWSLLLACCTPPAYRYNPAAYYSAWVCVLCYDRRSVNQSVLEQSTHPWLTTRSLLLSNSCGFVDLGRPLWREDGSVLCNCYWSSPAQSFSGPSPVGLVAIFYCLRFETSLFVASYDSQGHGWGIRPRLHTGWTTNWLCP
jgi:hypothetical protein